MSEYTPTMEEVRTAYEAGGGYRWPERGEQFDRWLAAHDRELRERIAQDIEAYAVFLDRALYPASTFARIARGEGSE